MAMPRKFTELVEDVDRIRGACTCSKGVAFFCAGCGVRGFCSEACAKAGHGRACATLRNDAEIADVIRRDDLLRREEAAADTPMGAFQTLLSVVARDEASPEFVARTLPALRFGGFMFEWTVAYMEYVHPRTLESAEGDTLQQLWDASLAAMATADDDADMTRSMARAGRVGFNLARMYEGRDVRVTEAQRLILQRFKTKK